MKTIWLSANVLGYELLKEGLSLKDPQVQITDLITLSSNSKTVMYDSVSQEDWLRLGVKTHLIDRIELSPDLVVMSGWRQIIPNEVLTIPKKGFIATHPSLLPYGRGPAAIINQIMNGTKNSGITLLYTSEGTDEGDIITQESYTIEDNDHAEDVYNKSVLAARKMIRDQLPLIAKGLESRISQNNSEAVVFESPKKLNKITPQDNLETIYNKIRAVSRPYKGAFIQDIDKRKLIIWRAQPTPQKPPGIPYSENLNLEDLASNPTSLYFEQEGRYLSVTEGEIK